MAWSAWEACARAACEDDAFPLRHERGPSCGGARRAGGSEAAGRGAGAIPGKHVCLGRLCSTVVGRRGGAKCPAGGGGEAVLECEGGGESQPACGGLGRVLSLGAVGLV